MAYARFGKDSDVYVMCSGEEWVCVSCLLIGASPFVCVSLLSLNQHLLDHVIAGHKVPQHTFERVYREIQDEAEKRLKG